jgi:hypothetical protein
MSQKETHVMCFYKKYIVETHHMRLSLFNPTRRLLLT